MKIPLLGVIVISESVTQYLGRPYGQCSHYERTSNNKFSAISHDNCLRKCLKQQCYRQLSCVPMFLKDFSSQYDFNRINQEICDKNRTYYCNSIVIDDKHLDNCRDMCPKDCVNVEHKHRIVSKEWVNESKYGPEFKHVMVYWDRNVPSLLLLEAPSITFVQLLIRIGGLLGLFHGIYIYQILVWLKTVIINQLIRYNI